MKYIEKLSREQVEKFFRLHGIHGEIEWYPELSRVNIGKNRIVNVTDISIKADRDMELTPEDWQVYLRQVFGEEYMRFLGKKDIPNYFIDQLTHEEILELIPFYHVYHFEECEALQKGTRRFKIRPGYDAALEEVVLGPCYYIGNVRFYGVKENMYYQFMMDRFGRDYYIWLKNRKLDAVREDIERYSLEKMKEAQKNLSFIEGFLTKKE